MQETALTDAISQKKIFVDDDEKSGNSNLTL